MRTLFSGILAGLFFASCAPTTPQARIQRQPEKFEALTPKHRELVERGQIERGMPQDAVYLAWGSPASVFQGSNSGRATERWDYAGSRPVFTNSFYGSYGRCFGPYRRGTCSGYGWGPEVVYVPYRIGSVWFIDNQVDSWERAR